MKKANPEIDKLRHNFKNYIALRNLDSSVLSDAFYLYRHDHTLDFLGLLNMADQIQFRAVAHEHLKKALLENSSAKGTNISAYMLALTRLWICSHGESPTSPPPAEKPVTALIPDLIPRPSCAEVERYLNKWAASEDLCQTESVLNTLFFKTHSQNTAIGDIILKASALNTIYGTHITSVYPVAKHILDLNIDERLIAGDETLVNELMRVIYDSGKKIDHYSFAIKYCSFHNQRDFPIYDSYVDKILRHYREQEGFASFKNADLKDYPTFKRILKDFCSHFGLQQYSVKEIDQYLWQFGKEYF